MVWPIRISSSRLLRGKDFDLDAAVFGVIVGIVRVGGLVPPHAVGRKTAGVHLVLVHERFDDCLGAIRLVMSTNGQTPVVEV